MDQSVGAAARLPGSNCKDLAIQALAQSETVSDLAARHGVSRKFIYQQTHKAVAALDDAFSPAVPDSAVLFEVAVTKAWLRQAIVGLMLICRSAYRGVVELLRDLLGLPVSLGCVHDVLEAATRQASAINHDQDLSGIRVGLHDEIFQGATPVLTGVDAQSTYCYLLAAEERRDADTWGVHLLDAAEQGLRPDDTIADAGQGLRTGQRTAWGDTPCHGDVFHIQRQCEGLASTLQRLAEGAASRRRTLQARTGRAGQRGPDDELAAQLARARQSEAQASWLARGSDQGRWLWACLSVRVPTQAVLPMFQKLVTWHGNVPVTVFRHAESLLHNRLRERRDDVFWCVSVLTGLAKHDSIIALPRHGSSDGAPFSGTGTTAGFPASG